MNALNRLGRYFSNLVFQNISALIALGIIRVIFSREGWWPQPDIYRIVNPMMMDLIPILFAFSGGRLIGQQRGGVIAAFVMMGVLAGNQTDYYMILPAIIIGPVVGYAIRKMDEWMQRYIPVGFELLLNNTASAAVGVIMAVLAYRFASPLFGAFIHFLITWTGFLVSSAFLPFVALIIEPAKVFFFNNVINHGILEPLGLNDLKGTGKSIFFLLESNPGPGFGLLLAYYAYTEKTERGRIKSLMIIQSIGGIHEVYFPYALMHPLLLIPLILAGFSADLVFYLLHAGLVAAPSPGSFLILLGLSPKGDHLAVFAGMLTSAVVSFVTSWLVLSFKKKSERKAPSALAEELPTQEPDMRDTGAFAHSDQPIRKIVFACDAGMGSSVMAAAMFRKHLAEHHIFALVKTASLDEIPQDADLVITIEHLSEQAIAKAPQARHLAMKAFNDQDFYKELVQKIKHQHLPQAPVEDQQAEKLHKQGLRSLITPQHIRLGAHAVDKWDAIEQAGRVLVECGHVTKEYIDEMLQRERMHSTYIAGCIALPHGKDAESPHIMGPGIAIVQFAEGVAFADDQKVRIVIAIAGRGEQQLAVLSKVARMIDEDTVRLLLEAKLPEQIIEIIS